MSTYNDPMAVDVRGIAKTGLTSSTTLANHLSGIAGAVRGVDGPGNAERVEEAMRLLNDLANAIRRLAL